MSIAERPLRHAVGASELASHRPFSPPFTEDSARAIAAALDWNVVVGKSVHYNAMIDGSLQKVPHFDLLHRFQKGERNPLPFLRLVPSHVGFTSDRPVVHGPSLQIVRRTVGGREKVRDVLREITDVMPEKLDVVTFTSDDPRQPTRVVEVRNTRTWWKINPVAQGPKK